MSSPSARVSVGTTATLLWQTTTGVAPDPDVDVDSQMFRAGTLNDPVPILIRNEDASASVDLGDLGVTFGAGTTLKAGESLTFNVTGNDSLYAVATSGTVAVSVLAQRQ